MTWQRYGLWYLCAALLLCAFVAVVNALVDPEGRILLVDEPGFNIVKFDAVNNRKGKARALRQCDYDALLVGTSRTETGIRVEQSALAGRHAYNASLRGASMYEMRQMVVYALEHEALKTAIIGVDLTSFNSEGTWLEDFEDSPLAPSVSPASMARYLLSWRTLKQSFYTVKGNRSGRAVLCGDRGEYIPRAGAKPAENIRAAFDFVLTRYASDYYRDFMIGEQHLQYFADALYALQSANVEVYVFIAPMHAVHVELLRELGLLDTYFDWKRSMVNIVADINARHRDAKPIVLWDFSGYNRVTTESVPMPEDSITMQWYKDSAHFNQEAGDLLMNEMMGLSAAELGTPLTPANIEQHIDAEDRASALYRARNPDEIKRLEHMLSRGPDPSMQPFQNSN